MSAELEIDDAVLQIRNKLQVDNVKLWLLPYYAEKTGSCEEEIKVRSQLLQLLKLKIKYFSCANTHRIWLKTTVSL